jgi:hypothetical protein
MQLEKYEVEASESFLKFEFFSNGSKGIIKKLIEFEPFEKTPNVFNIGFGDVDENGNINDLIITDNNDSQKVLATVALSIIKFFERYPNCYVFAKGSTNSRTRLYKIGITNNWNDISQIFEVYGFIEEKWNKFERNVNYEAFLIKLIKH